MKHLKRFNEGLLFSKEDWIDSLRDFCEMNLAYLLDDTKFKLTTKYSEICLATDEEFRWDDVKDYFIPFLIHLEKKFGSIINKIHIFISSRGARLSGWQSIELKDLLNDTIPDIFQGTFWKNIEIEI